GSLSLTAADTLVPGLTSTQAGITVNPAAAASLMLSGLPSTTVFVPSGGGGLSYNEDLVIANGSLYVLSRGNNRILRYDATTGAFQGVLVAANGLNDPIGLSLGPDGNLYVGNYGGNNVLRFKASDGTPLGTFVAAGSGGLNGPEGIAFGADG